MCSTYEIELSAGSVGTYLVWKENVKIIHSVEYGLVVFEFDLFIM